MEQNNRAYRILKRFMDGTLSSSSRKEIKRWLLSNHDMDEKEEAMRRIWDETDNDSDESIVVSLKSVHQKIQTCPTNVPHKFRFSRWLQYAAILLLPLITGVTVYWLSVSYSSNIEMTECYVPYGELRTVELPDGSTVQVNSGTLLIYPQKFYGKKRSVYLSGEAHFSVAKDGKKPFIVRTGPLNVEVLGTKFDIESYPGNDYITTTLEEGAIKIYKEKTPHLELFVKPDEQVIYYSEKDSFATFHVEASDYSAWMHGELRFRNKSLNEILATLERRYNIHFLVDEQIVCSDLYTIKFKSHETVDDALHVFALVVGDISYKKEGQTVRLYPKRKEVRP